MKTILHKSNQRGSANYGWLSAKYSFSFANYYNPQKVNFGALRVLNDDIIEGGTGFGTHPHDNMEIITIPLKGALKHKDSMSNEWIKLGSGEVQVMSAGAGLQHSEMNNSSNEPLNLFQIWIIPNERNVATRYDQRKFDALNRKNRLQTLVTSISENESGALKIHQNAKISRANLDENVDLNYQLKSNEHGVYIMVISGSVNIENIVLNERDALGIYNTDSFSVMAQKSSELLFIEVPMKF